MGNSQNKSTEHKNPRSVWSDRESQAFTSQFSLSHFVGNLSGRSLVSVTSNQSVFSASRPWSRVSRRRWNDSTLKNPLEASKTAWPVAHKESIFLPEFPITSDLQQKDFVIERTIAKGAFGEVYLVNRLSEDKKYALKVLNKSQELFLELIRKSAKIIENKSTETNSNKKKQDEWRKIQKTHSELSGTERSIAQLKGAWRRWKLGAKKEVSVHRKALRMTGGGEKPPSPTEEMKKIVEICPTDFIDEENKYDSDAIFIISENAVRQVKEETRIQTAIGHHSFIAGACSRWQTKKRLYIVSEYIPGGELLDLLDKYGKLPEELVKIFVAEIAIALDFLHNAGVIYRDLKPENILLDSDYHIKIIDFGLSKWLSIGARTSTICGTLKYMAPEVLSLQPYGHAVDWWSLGVIACRMLTDEYPTPAVRAKTTIDNTELAQTQSRENVLRSYKESGTQPGTLPASARDLSSAARGLLMRLLERDPRVRMRNLRQMQQSAFYMGFNFEQVKGKKVSPKSVLEKNYPNGAPKLMSNLEVEFSNFDQLQLA